MKKYNRVMLGQGSKYAQMCREDGYIGAEFDIFIDLSNDLYDNWRDFNKKFIPIWMNNVPGKSTTAASFTRTIRGSIARNSSSSLRTARC